MRVFVANKLADKVEQMPPDERDRVEAIIDRFNAPFPKIYSLVKGDRDIGDGVFLRRDGRYRVYYARSKTKDGTDVVIISNILTMEEDREQREREKALVLRDRGG